MNLKAVRWIFGAIVAAGLAAVTVMIATTLLPPVTEAQRKGTFIPWILTWGMVWETVLLALVVAGFLFVTGLNKGRSQQPQAAAGRP